MDPVRFGGKPTSPNASDGAGPSLEGWASVPFARFPSASQSGFTTPFSETSPSRCIRSSAPVNSDSNRPNDFVVQVDQLESRGLNPLLIQSPDLLLKSLLLAPEFRSSLLKLCALELQLLALHQDCNDDTGGSETREEYTDGTERVATSSLVCGARSEVALRHNPAEHPPDRRHNNEQHNGEHQPSPLVVGGSSSHRLLASQGARLSEARKYPPTPKTAVHRNRTSERPQNATWQPGAARRRVSPSLLAQQSTSYLASRRRVGSGIYRSELNLERVGNAEALCRHLPLQLICGCRG